MKRFGIYAVLVTLLTVNSANAHCADAYMNDNSERDTTFWNSHMYNEVSNGDRTSRKVPIWKHWDGKCPVCKRKGLTSTVTGGMGSQTLMYSPPFYDKDGNYHYHDPNTTTIPYDCSNGHHFSVTSVKPCPDPGCDYGADDEIVTEQESKLAYSQNVKKNIDSDEYDLTYWQKYLDLLQTNGCFTDEALDAIKNSKDKVNWPKKIYKDVLE